MPSSENSSRRIRHCPNEDCDGELQYQLDHNWMCLDCEGAWTAFDPEDGTDDLLLMDEECKEAARV